MTHEEASYADLVWGQSRQSLVSAQDFRLGMRRLAGACAIVTTGARHEGRTSWAGLTATAIASVSADPPRLLVCVNRNVWAHGQIAAGGSVGINVLGKSSEQLAMRFAGGKCAPHEKFAEGRWLTSVTGAPLLADAIAAFDCHVAEIVAASSHDIFICDVLAVRAAAEAEQPLIYFNGGFLP